MELEFDVTTMFYNLISLCIASKFVGSWIKMSGLLSIKPRKTLTEFHNHFQKIQPQI